MTDDCLTALLGRNADHVDSLPADHFAAVQDGQQPPVVSICCSDSRVSQEGMFDVSEPGELFTPSNIGNQVWDRVQIDGDRRTVVDGSLLYPLVHTGTRTVAVVGHTGCGAVTAAYEHATAAGESAGDEQSGEAGAGAEPAGIREYVDTLLPVVEDGLESGVGEAADPGSETIDRLVEYNVDRQVAFLRESDDVPDGTALYGFVYDLQRSYGGPAGRLYLVNAGGDREVGALRERVGASVRDHVCRLTEY
jgi:carbonic anhydrase